MDPENVNNNVIKLKYIMWYNSVKGTSFYGDISHNYTNYEK